MSGQCVAVHLSSKEQSTERVVANSLHFLLDRRILSHDICTSNFPPVHFPILKFRAEFRYFALSNPLPVTELVTSHRNFEGRERRSTDCPCEAQWMVSNARPARNCLANFPKFHYLLSTSFLENHDWSDFLSFGIKDTNCGFLTHQRWVATGFSLGQNLAAMVGIQPDIGRNLR